MRSLHGLHARCKLPMCIRVPPYAQIEQLLPHQLSINCLPGTNHLSCCNQSIAPVPLPLPLLGRPVSPPLRRPLHPPAAPPSSSSPPVSRRRSQLRIRRLGGKQAAVLPAVLHQLPPRLTTFEGGSVAYDPQRAASASERHIHAPHIREETHASAGTCSVCPAEEGWASRQAGGQAGIEVHQGCVSVSVCV
jgi:hypothetical protein